MMKGSLPWQLIKNMYYNSACMLVLTKSSCQGKLVILSACHSVSSTVRPLPLNVKREVKYWVPVSQSRFSCLLMCCFVVSQSRFSCWLCVFLLSGCWGRLCSWRSSGVSINILNNFSEANSRSWYITSHNTINETNHWNQQSLPALWIVLICPVPLIYSIINVCDVWI